MNKLSERNKLILEKLHSGKSIGDVAREFDLSVSTVRNIKINGEMRLSGGATLWVKMENLKGGDTVQGLRKRFPYMPGDKVKYKFERKYIDVVVTQRTDVQIFLKDKKGATYSVMFAELGMDKELIKG